MLHQTGIGKRLLHRPSRGDCGTSRCARELISTLLLKLTFETPPDTPYEFGTFLLEIHVPETYPFNPPKVKFLTKIWHPNISSVTGAICLDILKDNWAAAMTLRTVLLSLQALLASPEPDDPQDAVVASQYKENFEMFCRTAKHWTNSYAKGKKILSTRSTVIISRLYFRSTQVPRLRHENPAPQRYGHHRIRGSRRSESSQLGSKQSHRAAV